MRYLSSTFAIYSLLSIFLLRRNNIFHLKGWTVISTVVEIMVRVISTTRNRMKDTFNSEILGHFYDCSYDCTLLGVAPPGRFVLQSYDPIQEIFKSAKNSSVTLHINAGVNKVDTHTVTT